MLLIAQELGFSETAFLVSPDGPDPLPIQYFTPIKEVPLCGHATLASALVLFTDWQRDAVTFVNIDGERFDVTKRGESIAMKFPTYSTHPAEAPIALLDALGISAVVNCEYNDETNILLLEIPSASELRALDPDYGAMVASHDSLYGVVVTAAAGDDIYDYHSRFFWPWSGTNEDPVTGGTQTFLAPYWSKRLARTSMHAFQSSNRAGSMRVDVGDNVLITGQGTIVLRGTIYL
jgi:PhzF family phenazine biosynthesis protein